MTETTDWISHFPGLTRLPAEVQATLAAGSSIVALPAGTRIYGPGQAPEHFLLLIDGSVRVQQVSDTGREIVLYRIAAGESCALTTACLMSYDDYLAEAIAENDVRAVAIPRAAFDDLIAHSPDFRRFVFVAFSARVTELFRIIDEVAFARMDIRLAHRLLELAKGTTEISVTQQQLAAELGSAREVISRILSEFQRRGWVTSTRGNITINNPAALQELH